MNPINAEKYLTSRIVNGGPNLKNGSIAKQPKGRNRQKARMLINVKAVHKDSPGNSSPGRIGIN